MVEPSCWLRSGITVERIDGVNLVKLTDELHTRLEESLERRKVEYQLNFHTENCC
jgi:hypothetical protein